MDAECMKDMPIEKLYELAREDLMILLDPRISHRLKDLASFIPENPKHSPILFITVFALAMYIEQSSGLMKIMILLLDNGADLNARFGSETILDTFLSGIRASSTYNLTEERKNALMHLIGRGMDIECSGSWWFNEYTAIAIIFCKQYKQELEEELCCKEPDMNI